MTERERPTQMRAMATDSEARAFFDSVAERYDRTLALSGAASKERLATLSAALGARRRVVVLGLGTGRELPALLDAGRDVVGVELSSAMAAQCARRARTVPVIAQSFWEPLPFAAASFDAVVALHGTLAHPPTVDATAALVTECARVLTDDGLFFAEVPSVEGVAKLAREAPGALEAIGTEGAFLHRDARTGLSLGGRAFAIDRWNDWLRPHFDGEARVLSPWELVVIARRRARG